MLEMDACFSVTLMYKCVGVVTKMSYSGGEDVFLQLVSFLMISSANVAQNIFISCVRASILKVQ